MDCPICKGKRSLKDYGTHWICEACWMVGHWVEPADSPAAGEPPSVIRANTPPTRRTTQPCGK